MGSFDIIVLHKGLGGRLRLRQVTRLIHGQAFFADSCGCIFRRSHSPVGVEGHTPRPQCPGTHRSG